MAPFVFEHAVGYAGPRAQPELLEIPELCRLRCAPAKSDWQPPAPPPELAFAPTPRALGALSLGSGQRSLPGNVGGGGLAGGSCGGGLGGGNAAASQGHAGLKCQRPGAPLRQAAARACVRALLVSIIQSERQRAAVRMQGLVRRFLAVRFVARRHAAAGVLQSRVRGFLQRLRGHDLGRIFLAARRAASEAAEKRVEDDFVRSHRWKADQRATLRGIKTLLPSSAALRAKVMDQLLRLAHRREQLQGMLAAKEFLVRLRNDVTSRVALGEKLSFAPVLLSGPPGTGKRLVAKLLHEELTALQVCKGPFVETRDWEELKSAFKVGESSGAVSCCVYVSGIDESIRKVLRRTLQALPTALLIFGLNDEERMREICAYFVKCEPVQLELQPFTVEELAEITRRSLEQRGFQFSGGLNTSMLVSVISETWSSSEIANRNGHLAAIMIERAMYNRNQRMPLRFASVGNPGVLLPEDFGIKEVSKADQAEKKAAVMKELESMPGFGVAKKFFQQIHRRLEYVESGGGHKNVLEMCMNLVITGNPGTGKTSFARLLFRLLHAHGALKKDVFIEVNALELKGKHCGDTAPKVINLVRSARGGCLFIDEAYALAKVGGSKDRFGVEAVSTLLTEVERHRTEVLVIMAGYKDKMGVLMAQDPGLARRFPLRLDLPDYSVSELALICNKVARERFGVDLEAGLLPRIERLIEEKHKSEISRQNASLAVALVEQAIEMMSGRLLDRECPNLHPLGASPLEEQQQQRHLAAADFGIEASEEETAELERERLRRELDGLIGMSGPKEHLRRIEKRAEFVRRGGSPKLLETCLNVVLTGNPGTGKTTFARLLFRFLRAHGVLKRDVFTERNALELKGEYCGQTAPKIREVFGMARGGCLFLDEAYALANGDKFSNEAIRMLLTEVENHRTEVLVVLAGYEDKMVQLMNSDPGLARRFPHSISLPDYTASELAAIASVTAAERFGVPFEEDLEDALSEWFGNNMERLCASKHNAGLAVNVVEEALGRLAERATASEPVANANGPSSLSAERLTLDDFGLASTSEPRRRRLLLDAA